MFSKMQNCMSLGCVRFLRERLRKFCHINLHHFPPFLALLFTHEAHFERNWRYDQTQSCVSILYCPSSMIWTVRLSICQLLCKIEAVRQVTWWSGIPSYKECFWWGSNFDLSKGASFPIGKTFANRESCTFWKIEVWPPPKTLLKSSLVICILSSLSLA